MPINVKIELADIINESFDFFSFSMLLSRRLNKQIMNYAPLAAPYDYVKSVIIDRAIAEEWLNDLVYVMQLERPKNVRIYNLALYLGIATDIYAGQTSNSLTEITRPALQYLVNGDPFLEPEELIDGITINKRRVCRIHFKDKENQDGYGTGFLVGKNLLLTNFHVVVSFIKNVELAKEVTCKFDYAVSASGKTINKGVDVGLDAENPIQAYSEYCEYDVKGTPSVEVTWPEGKYDYALLKLAEEIGEKPFAPDHSNSNGNDQEKRGWIKACQEEPSFFKGSHMIIFQHPDKMPLKIALGMSKVIGTDEKKRRVRYEINTLPGSSGSPCFDHNFCWIAMHNLGDPSWNPIYNQGIPAALIINDLKEKGILL